MANRTRIKYADRNEWLEGRKLGIGASEVGTILGVNPFDTPYRMWRRKKGMDAPIPENTAMLMGHMLEDVVAQRFAYETGLDVIKSSQEDFMFVNPDKPFLRVSPDRTFWLPDMPHNDDNKGILECKTTAMAIDPDDIPTHWFCQLQYNLHVGHYKVGYLAWLTNGREFGMMRVDYDEELCRKMEEALEDFWNRYIVGDETPEDTNGEDTSIRWARQTTGKALTADVNIQTDCIRLAELKGKEKELKKESDEIKDRLKVAMQDCESIVVEGQKKPLVTWKAGADKQVFDTDKFKAEHPDMYEKYLVTKAASRTFLVK